MPRLFVGVAPPDDVRASMAGIIRDLSRHAGDVLRPTRPENIHLTLQFLGETPAERVEAVADALADIGFAAFTLRPGGVIRLPDRGRPRVLLMRAAEGEAPCADLAKQVRDAMEPLGYPRGKSFFPHFTLARVRRSGDADWAALVAHRPTTTAAFTVDRFVLWRSVLTPDGPIYTALRELRAAGG